MYLCCVSTWKWETDGTKLVFPFESSIHAGSKLPEKHCCYRAFSYCRHGSEKKMSFPERNLLLPGPSWKLILLCSIPKVKLNVNKPRSKSLICLAKQEACSHSMRPSSLLCFSLTVGSFSRFLGTLLQPPFRYQNTEYSQDVLVLLSNIQARRPFGTPQCWLEKGNTLNTSLGEKDYLSSTQD